jgi:hypothetical protein
MQREEQNLFHIDAFNPRYIRLIIKFLEKLKDDKCTGYHELKELNYQRELIFCSKHKCCVFTKSYWVKESYNWNYKEWTNIPVEHMINEDSKEAQDMELCWILTDVEHLGYQVCIHSLHNQLKSFLIIKFFKVTTVDIELRYLQSHWLLCLLPSSFRNFIISILDLRICQNISPRCIFSFEFGIDSIRNIFDLLAISSNLVPFHIVCLDFWQFNYIR